MIPIQLSALIQNGKSTPKATMDLLLQRLGLYGELGRFFALAGHFLVSSADFLIPSGHFFARFCLSCRLIGQAALNFLQPQP